MKNFVQRHDIEKYRINYIEKSIQYMCRSDHVTKSRIALRSEVKILRSAKGVISRSHDTSMSISCFEKSRIK